MSEKEELERGRTGYKSYEGETWGKLKWGGEKVKTGRKDNTKDIWNSNFKMLYCFIFT